MAARQQFRRNLYTPAGYTTLIRSRFDPQTADAIPSASALWSRMPVIFDPDDEALWLDPEVTDPAAVLGFPGPYPEGLMTADPVSTAVNAVGNDGPELVRPLSVR